MIDNPGFELGEESEDGSVWSGWMQSADLGLEDDGGAMIIGFRLEPEPDHYPSLLGSVPIYKDGWTSIGMTWNKATGEFRTFVNSKRRPWWAKGILYRLWYWWVAR